jgi:hypothetical protein
MRFRFLLPRQVREKEERNGTQVVMRGWSESHKQSQCFAARRRAVPCERSAGSDETARPLLAMPREVARDPQSRFLRNLQISGRRPVLASGRGLAATAPTAASGRVPRRWTGSRCTGPRAKIARDAP